MSRVLSLVLGIGAVVLVPSFVVAQQSQSPVERGGHTLALNTGGGWALGDTLAKSAGLQGVVYSQRVRAHLDVEVGYTTAYDGRSSSGGQGGEGSFRPSGHFLRIGPHVWRQRKKGLFSTARV